MSATIINMDYVHVDNLSADQLLEDDLIEVSDEVVRIISIAPTKEGIIITFDNEFGEKDILEFDDNKIFKLFVMQ